MARVEIHQAKDYLMNVASRAIGIGYYRDEQKSIQIAELLGIRDRVNGGIFLGTLALIAPAFMRTRMMDSKITHYFPEKKLQNLVRGVATLGTTAVDIAPFALGLLVDPSFLLGKPLLNVTSQVAADIVQAKLDPESRLPKAPEGTYAYLKELSNQFLDPITKKAVIKQKGGISAIVFEEEVCNIGGSCMEFILVHNNTAGTNVLPWTQSAHITKEDRVVNTMAMFNPDPELNAPPTLEDLLRQLRDLVPEETKRQE